MKTVLTVAGAATLAFAGYILVFKKLSILCIKSMRWTPSRLLAKVRVLAVDAFSRRLHAPGEKARNLDETLPYRGRGCRCSFVVRVFELRAGSGELCSASHDRRGAESKMKSLRKTPTLTRNTSSLTHQGFKKEVTLRI